jgi:hypothetical protein
MAESLFLLINFRFHLLATPREEGLIVIKVNAGNIGFA